MSIKLLSAVWDLEMDSTKKMVLMCLCNHANDEGVCWPSVATIRKKCGNSERTVQSALKWLSDNGYFKFYDVPGKGRTYRLNPRKICTPAKSAPVQKTTDTPAESAPHPRKICTLIPNEPSVTLDVSNDTSAPAKRETPKRDPVGAFVRPEWADEVVWADFLKNRKAKRLTNTETAYRAFLRDIEKFVDDDWPPGRLLEAIVSRGWGAAYDPRPKFQGSGYGNRNYQAAGGASAGHRGPVDNRNSFLRSLDETIGRSGPGQPDGPD